MTARDGIAARAAPRGEAATAGANPALRSVLLDLCARHGARRILCLGRGGEPLALSLRQAGYAAWGMDPDGNPPTVRVNCAPAPPAGATGLHPAAPAAGVRFDLALSTETAESCAAFGEQVAFAEGALRPGGLFLLSTPYRDSLARRVSDLYARWWPRHDRARGDSPWSRPRLQRLLESRGFVLVEAIGVRDASWRLHAVVWVARQGGRPQVGGDGGCGDLERGAPPLRHGRAPAAGPTTPLVA